MTVIKFIEDKNLADTDKLIFAGTSHGGGMAMVLASYYGKERCMAVCADLPYLIGFSTNRFFDLLYEYSPPIDIRFRASEAKKRLSLVDPEWHASRLKMPVSGRPKCTFRHNHPRKPVVMRTSGLDFVQGLICQ